MARRAALTLAAVAATAVLAGCGPQEPKVSSADYVQRCEDELNRQDRVGAFSEADVAEICRCTQDELVERGDGDKRLDDASLDDGAQLARECALALLERK